MAEKTRYYKPASRVRVKRTSHSIPRYYVLRETVAAKEAVHFNQVTNKVQTYADFKAAFESVTEEIKSEIREQHAMTRAEVKVAKRDILEAVRESPVAFVKLTCEYTALFMLFALALRFLLKIELVNTAFALFALAALSVYWTMAWVQQRSHERDSESPTQ